MCAGQDGFILSSQRSPKGGCKGALQGEGSQMETYGLPEASQVYCDLSCISQLYLLKGI